MASTTHVSNGNEKKKGNKYRHIKGKDKIKHWNNKKKKKINEADIIKRLEGSYQSIDTSKIKTFSDFPLSEKTLKGLKENNFNEPTEIQRESLGFSLQGLDILGAAKTGSGKTLAFLIPVIERLYCQQWTGLDGVGALIITPTRELAFQIFETLRKFGQHHDLSAGLIIGGKDLKFESKRMDKCNIVIGTPGRILQHMDENPLFDCSSMKILVLDEADRCLDLGFEKTMNSIIENLPPERQTLLFSATQTKSVRDLARLSLRDPMYVSVHEHAKHATPESLRQSYVVCELHDKMSMLWSFLRNHKRKKILVFLSSCKQVKYTYEILCRLRPGISLMALYGTLHQMRRMAVYEDFCKKKHAVLFATDVAARGLDFPDIDWVLQLDCPEDAATYVHRAGRTARYTSGGESLLVLLPSEREAMVVNLEQQRVPIENIKVNPKKLQSAQRKMEALLARDPELKASAQRAFISYAKSIFLMKDKNVFDVKSLDLESYARSLGLAMAPRVRFLQRHLKKEAEKQIDLPAQRLADDDDSSEASNSDVEQPVKLEKSSAVKDTYNFATGLSDNEENEEDGMLTLKRKDHDLEGEDVEEVTKDDEDKEKKIVTKAALAKKVLKKKIVANKKTVFNEEGEIVRDAAREKVTEVARKYEEDDSELGGIDINKAKEVMKEEDKIDKQRFKERLKAKRREAKLKLKQRRQEALKEDQAEEEEGDSDESDGPDLSWLPDPDKIYGKLPKDDRSEGDESGTDKEQQEDSDQNSVSEGDSGQSDEESESEQADEESESGHSEIESESQSETEQPQFKRRKLETAKKSVIRPKNTGLSLKEDEELALQFLRNKR